MVEVLIDDQRCDFEATESISLSYSSSGLVDLESGRTGSSIEFKLPLNVTNCAVFGIEGDVHSPQRFNSQWHSMVILSDKITLFKGTAYLMQVVWSEGKRYLIVECRGGVFAWAQSAATTLFKDIDIEYLSSLSEITIKESWESDSPVKFFPVVRDKYVMEWSSSDFTGVREVRTIDDYHPFIQVSALITAIFNAAGYRVESQTAQEECFDELYISGGYNSQESAAAQESMGFYARRSEDCTTVANSLGMVSMSPYDVIANVGNIVDIESVADDPECYNHGNVLQIDNEAVIFRPLTAVSVGFEYYLHYTCDCTIESRSKLKGVDTLNTINNGHIKWEINNRYVDQQDNISLGINYNVVIFDFEPGDSFILYGMRSATYRTRIKDVTARFSPVVFTAQYIGYKLYKYNGSAYVEYTGDWAIYFGYATEVTPTEVKVVIRSSPKLYTPLSPMQFEFQILKGAEPFSEFTIHKDSSVRPYFSAYPGYNTTIEFGDIAHHPYTTALDFLSSMQHLFNLRFLTNEADKCVTIESFDNFYSGSQWDWSDKVVEGCNIEFRDFATLAHRSNTYGYQKLDGVIRRMGESGEEYFGEWDYSVDSYVATPSKQTRLNPMLCATTNDEDGAFVVGDRDDVDSLDSLGFSPRIAKFISIKEIDGENYSLPYISFHAPQENFTLCFEDRDGVQGLNRLYQSEVALTRRSQLLSLTLRLTALDYSNLFEPCEGAASCRSIFNFDLHGESFKALLYSIDRYDAQTGEAKCTFLTVN